MVDLGEPTAFHNHVYLGCTQRECKPNENVACKYKEMFESSISAAANEKLPGWEKPHAKTVAWSFDMEGHARKCMDRYCELAHNKTEQLYKVSSPCQDDHQFKQEELETTGELSNVCSQICLKCLYLARIVRPRSSPNFQDDCSCFLDKFHDFQKYLGSRVFVQKHNFNDNKDSTQRNTRKTQRCTKNAQPSTWHTQLLMTIKHSKEVVIVK